MADEGRIKDIIKSGAGLNGLYKYANNSAGDKVDVFEKFSDFMTGEFSKKFGEQIGIKLPPYVTGAINDKMPEFVEKNFIRGPGEKLSQVFSFLILFAVFMAVIGFVAVKTSAFGLLNGYDRLDKFFGGVLGIARAAVAMFAMAVIVKIMIDVAESSGSFFSYETVDKTYIFKHFFEKV